MAIAPRLPEVPIPAPVQPYRALLIKYNLTARVWRPLIAASRRRHLRLRPSLASLPLLDASPTTPCASAYISAGV